MNNAKIKELNKFEVELQNLLSKVMKEESVKFTKFLPVLVDNLPEKGSLDYLKTNKKEYIKFIRSSFTVQEILKMLEVVNWKLVFKLNELTIDIDNYALLDQPKFIRLKFVDLMASCSLLNIQIFWQKVPMQSDVNVECKID